MKTLEGSFTMLVDRDGARIEIHDKLSRVCIAIVTVEPGDFMAALGRLAYVPCSMHVNLSENIGKKLEVSSFEFPLPDDCGYGLRRAKIAKQLADKYVPDGWVADSYFSSQDSFFTTDNKQYARCSMRRWVDVDEADNKEVE